MSGCKSDEDDDYDSTYAYFRFEIPEALKPVIDDLKEQGAEGDPAKRWKEMLAKMQTRDLNDPDVARAREVEEEIFEAILRDEKK